MKVCYPIMFQRTLPLCSATSNTVMKIVLEAYHKWKLSAKLKILVNM